MSRAGFDSVMNASTSGGGCLRIRRGPGGRVVLTDPFSAILGAAFGVPADKAYFYPEGVEGLFEIYYAPADTFETVNTLGLPLYARTIPDRDRDEWVRLEIESNPLPICTRPQALRSGRRT